MIAKFAKSLKRLGTHLVGNIEAMSFTEYDNKQ